MFKIFWNSVFGERVCETTFVPSGIISDTNHAKPRDAKLNHSKKYIIVNIL